MEDINSGAGGAEPSALTSTLADQADLTDLVTEYVRDMPSRAQALHRALECGDMTTFKRLVHQLKGTAGGYGFQPISDAATRLEEALSASGDFGKIGIRLNDLIRLCGMARPPQSKV